MFSICVMLSSVACSEQEDMGTSESKSQDDSMISNTEDIKAPEEPTEPEISIEEEEVLESQKVVFRLGKDDTTKKTIGTGDHLGDWTVDDLTITYKLEQINRVEATFQGVVTIKGRISPSGLIEGEYDFVVSDEDMEKMPFYTASETSQNMFMLEFDESIGELPTIEYGEKLDCTITMSEYRYIMAYMMAPASATVTDIEFE